MAEIKWIKITTTMFDDEKLKLIDAMPERDTIHYVWVRLLVQAGKTNASGYIFLNENVPYTDEMLATIFNRPLNTIRLALKTLSSFGMITIQEDNLIKISNWDKHQNIEGMEKIKEQNRLRKQKQRENEKGKLIENNTSRDSHVTVTQQNKNKNKNKIEIKNIEKDNNNNNINIDAEKSYIDFFNNNFHMITMFELETLNSFKNDGMEDEVIKLAMEKAVENNVRTINYVKAILQKWLEKNIKTVEAVNAADKEFKRNKVNPGKSKSEFTNCQQRDYSKDEIKELEKKLLGWDKNG